MNYLSIFPHLMQYYVCMRCVRRTLACALFFTFCAYAAEPYCIRDTFVNLDNWKPISFRGISRHSSYTIEESDGRKMLKLTSSGSASALVMKQYFDVRRYPVLRWRWKVDNIYKSGNGMVKEGDDYPVRIYIAFRFDESAATPWERIKYTSYRLIYGEYPPHSSLIYAWGSNESVSLYASPYTDRARILLKQKGSGNIGKWITEEADILADYQRAFGSGTPPATAVVGIMNDSDNTGESSASYIEFIEISGRSEK